MDLQPNGTVGIGQGAEGRINMTNIYDIYENQPKKDGVGGKNG